MTYIPAYNVTLQQAKIEKWWCILSLFVQRKDLFIVEIFFLASTETEPPPREIRWLMASQAETNHGGVSAEKKGLKSSIYFNINNHQRLPSKDRGKKTQLSHLFVRHRECSTPTQTAAAQTLCAKTETCYNNELIVLPPSLAWAKKKKN